MSVKCYSCNNDIDIVQGSDVGRQEECPSCHVDLRCCKMCEFYDPTAYNECREPMAERIVDKEKGNFCDFYKIGGGQGGSNGKDDLLAKANALFK